MKTKIRKIGNSSGVLISKAILLATKISDEDSVSISVDNDRIIIEKVKSLREGWEQQFLSAKEEPENYFPEGLPNKFDKEEWTW